MRRPGPAGSIRDAIKAVTKRSAEPPLATAPPVAVCHDLLLLRVGQSALMLGHFDHAVTIYTRALELNREDAQAWYGQGKAFAGMGTSAEPSSPTGHHSTARRISSGPGTTSA